MVCAACCDMALVFVYIYMVFNFPFFCFCPFCLFFFNLVLIDGMVDDTSLIFFVNISSTEGCSVFKMCD